MIFGTSGAWKFSVVRCPSKQVRTPLIVVSAVRRLPASPWATRWIKERGCLCLSGRS